MSIYDYSVKDSEGKDVSGKSNVDCKHSNRLWIHSSLQRA